MPKYKVTYSDYLIVEAASLEEAEQLAFQRQIIGNWVSDSTVEEIKDAAPNSAADK